MTSLWLDRTGTIPTDSFIDQARYDTVIVGGGLTGLTTALLLARSGQRVAVLEARTLAAVTTGNTTGKLSLLHGGQLSQLLAANSVDVAQAYVDANREGQQWMLRYCNEHHVPFQEHDAYTYAGTPGGEEQVRREYEACRTAGLDVTLETDTALPYPTWGAVRLADQAQFDPLDVVEALTRDVRAHGGHVVEGAFVTGIDKNAGGIETRTENGVIRSDRVVLATGTPILNRGGHFARLQPLRSYALAFTVPGTVPHGMYLSIDSPTRSLRTSPTHGEEHLIVGGNGHVVGRQGSALARVRDLEAWTAEHFPNAVLTHSWSAQDYRSLDRAPYAGPITPGDDRIFVATGFNKWGMTNAVAASLALAGRLLDGAMAWADTLYDRPVTIADAADAVQVNGSVGFEMAKDWVSQALRSRPDAPPAEGTGMVYREGVRPVGACTVGGVTNRVSAVCPHMHGVLSWNDDEASWDCPLHGSRFTHDGRRLEGPALSDLERLPLEGA